MPTNSKISVSLSDIEVRLPGIWVPGDVLRTGDIFTTLQTSSMETDLSKRFHATASVAVVSYISNTRASEGTASPSGN